MTDEDLTTAKAAPPARNRREVARRLGAAGVGGLIVAFALLNRKKVDVNWILGTWSTSLILVIAISFLLGVVGGFLLRARQARGRQRARERKA
jgi:uncharacterized integral membrane protein